MASILTVDGTAYDQADRKANSLIVDGWGWDLEENGYWLEFHEYCAGYQSRFTSPKPVSFVDHAGVLRFTGDIVGVQPGWSDEGRTWGYRCQGLENRVNWLPVTGYDGSAWMDFNLKLDDENYLPSTAGKTVGQILTAILTQHATALGSLGISTDATTTSQLASMTLVPNESVQVGGERLWSEIEWVVKKWIRNIKPYITPQGKIRFIDTTAGTSRTLTLGVDPVEPPLLRRSTFNCATRIVVRGRPKIYPVYVSLLRNTLQKPWTGPQEAAWTMADFEKPGDAYDVGTVTTTGGPTSITVKSSDGARGWPANFWSDRQAWVYLESTTGTGLAFSESRPVTACTALSAGGTSTLTLGLALDNSASTAWNKYTLIGKAGDLANGRNNVYRLLNVVTAGNWVEQHLAVHFPQPVPFVGLNNASATLVSSPVCMIIYDGGKSIPATFRVIPSTGQILFDRPYVERINQPSDLAAGGAAVKQPDDIVVMLAYSRGALEAVYPPDVAGVPQYAGTAYDVAGMERTRYADTENWLYEGNQAQMQEMAQMLHQSCCDIFVDGGVRYFGEYTDVWSPDVGHRMCFASNCGTTGDEALNVPVRSVSVRYSHQGGGCMVVTEMSVSNSRNPRTDQGYFAHLSQLGSGVQPFGEGNWQDSMKQIWGKNFGEGNWREWNKLVTQGHAGD